MTGKLISAYREIFFRIYRQQRRRHAHSLDAFVYAVAFLSFPLLVWLTLLDFFVAEQFNVPSLFQRPGRWGFIFAALALVFGLNYFLLRSQRGRTDESPHRLESQRWGTLLVVGYFVLPVAAFIAFAVIVR